MMTARTYDRSYHEIRSIQEDLFKSRGDTEWNGMERNGREWIRSNIFILLESAICRRMNSNVIYTSRGIVHLIIKSCDQINAILGQKKRSKKITAVFRNTNRW